MTSVLYSSEAIQSNSLLVFTKNLAWQPWSLFTFNVWKH